MAVIHEPKTINNWIYPMTKGTVALIHEPKTINNWIYPKGINSLMYLMHLIYFTVVILYKIKEIGCIQFRFIEEHKLQ